MTNEVEGFIHTRMVEDKNVKGRLNKPKLTKNILIADEKTFVERWQTGGNTLAMDGR